MIKASLKKQNLGIVLIGDFIPKIFHPNWFVYQKLLGKEEGESADIEIIHNDLVIFNIDWLRLEVTRNRIVASARLDQYYEVLRDLIYGTFVILSHTPLRMLGINNYYEYMVSSSEDWHLLGDILAPKDIWFKVLDKPGLKSLTIEGKNASTEDYRSMYSITSGPSKEKLSFKISTNYHFELISTVENVVESNKILKILADEWASSQERAKNIGNTIFNEIK
ncbi:hypothetical protein KAR91_77050 [Candidatus Pacearchaeota archaeon]|nr:hypothetical protein [Candidatus Pacearchaeota archaeon]